MNSYRDTAVIKLPTTARIKRAGEQVTKVETATAFEEGAAVSIELGYNGLLKNEFVGFVSRVNFSQPLEVECEGYSYLLRKKSDYEKRTFKKAQLRDIIRFLINGTSITMAGNVPDFVVEKFVIDGRSGTEYLEELKKVSKNTLLLYFDGKVLNAGMMYLQAADPSLKSLPVSKVVKYRLGWNVAKDNQLKVREPKNENVTINFIGEKKDGSKEVVIVNGKKRTKAATVTAASSIKSGETKIIKTHDVVDKDTLKLLANAKQEQLSYSGYEGKITAFLVPYCQPNWMASIEDKKFPDRSGQYLVVSVEVSYGMGGARRVVEIGKRIYGG